MRILIKSDDSNARVMEGLHNAAFDCGFSSLIWNERSKPSFDTIHEFQPELVVCYGDTKGTAIQSACDANSIKLVNISPTKIEGDTLAAFHRPSADLLKCKQDKSKEHEIITLSEVENRELLKLAGVGIKCFSYENKLNSPCYLGTVTSQESHELLCSSKMFYIFGDDWELMCNCIASDCIPIVINNNFMPEDIMPTLTNIDDVISQVNKISSQDSHRIDILKKCKQLLFSTYTYHHRLSEVMTIAGKEDSSKAILEKLDEYK